MPPAVPETTGLLVIVGLLAVKEAGLPIPVPGDLLVIGAGVAAGQGRFDPIVALVAIVLAGIAGGIVQYGLLRSVARPAILRVIDRFGGRARVDSQTERLRRGGARSVALARSTPGIRIVAIAASALAGVPVPAFILGLAVGNGAFVGAHFALGYVVGEPIVTAAGGLIGPLTAGIVGLAVIGGIGWAVLRRRRSAAEARRTDAATGTGPTVPRSRPDPLATLGAWADACCPACLALAVADRSG